MFIKDSEEGLDMKAVVLKSSNNNDFDIMDLDIPNINDDELLLKVKAIGVGVHDGYFFPQEMNFPYVIGIEASGIVEKLGSNIKDFRIGDRLALVSMMQSKGGVWAEYAAISMDSLIVKIPNEMSFVEAASVLVAGNTVLKALRALDLKKGDHLFIAGGSGAIGTLAIQLAKKQGLIVSASASLENHDYMKDLGAKVTVDYKDPFWIEALNKLRPGGQDAVLAIARNTSTECMKVLKDDGKILSVSNDRISNQDRVRVVDIPYQLDVQKELEEMMDDLVKGKLQIEIEKVFPFREALSALASKSKQHARGKTVISLENLND